MEELADKPACKLVPMSLKATAPPEVRESALSAVVPPIAPVKVVVPVPEEIVKVSESPSPSKVEPNVMAPLPVD